MPLSLKVLALSLCIGAIVTQGSAGLPGSLLSIHAGCISDQKKGEWTPTYPRKKIGAGGGSFEHFTLAHRSLWSLHGVYWEST